MSNIKLAGLIVAPILLAIFLLFVGINLTEVFIKENSMEAGKSLDSSEVSSSVK